LENIKQGPKEKTTKYFYWQIYNLNRTMVFEF
jgi:hypothetical protein